MVKIKLQKCCLLMLAVLLIIELTGCTANTGEILDEDSESVKTITMWKFRSNKEDYVINRWVKQWNEDNPDLQVNFELIPYNDYLTNRLPTAFATNSAPDIYMISAGSFLKYARAGYMLPLDDYISSELKNDLTQESLEVATYNNKILGIPIEHEPVALFYNKEVFKKQGLKPPTTWEELENCAKQLQSDVMSGICLPTQVNDYQNFIFYTFLVQEATNSSYAMTVTDFATSGTKALNLWRSLAKYNYTLGTNVEMPSDIYPFATGKSAMQVCGFWAVNSLNKYYPDLDYGIVPVPNPEGDHNVSVYGGWYQSVNPDSEYAKEAAEFTIWMWGDDTSRPYEWCTEASTKVPARKSVIEKNRDIFYEGINSLFTKDILPSAVPEPRYPVEISNIISNAIQDAMYSEKDINEIAKAAEDEMNKYISKNSEIF